MAEYPSEVGEAVQTVGQEALRATVSVSKEGFKISIDAARTIVKDMNVPLTLLGLSGMYLVYELAHKIIEGVLHSGLGGEKDDKNIQGTQPNVLHVLLHCSTDERFLEVLDDFKTGRMKARLILEFSFRTEIEIEGLVVNIENIHEVEEKAAAINERKDYVRARSLCEVGRSAQSFSQEAHCSTDSGGDFKIIIDTDRINISDAAISSGSAISLDAMYKMESHVKKINAAINKGLGGEVKDQEIRDIQPKCLHVLLHCFTDKRFLEVLDDFESGRMKQRLQMEFSFVGIQTVGLVVNVENIHEVEEKATALNMSYTEKKENETQQYNVSDFDDGKSESDKNAQEGFNSMHYSNTKEPGEKENNEPDQENPEEKEKEHCSPFSAKYMEIIAADDSEKAKTTIPSGEEYQANMNVPHNEDKCEIIKAATVGEFINDQGKQISRRIAQSKSYTDYNSGYNPKYSLKKIRTIDTYTLTDAQLTSSEQVPDYILKTLMIADYHAREFKLKPLTSVKDKDKTEAERFKTQQGVVGINPMDAMLDVFHFSDHFLRQYLAIKLSACQLSVPFLLPDPAAPSENVTMLLSALEGITKSWKDPGKNNVNAFATEYPFPVVSFLRIGETMSKSSLMNKVMSDGIGHHNYFFHRGMKGGRQKRKTVDGLVELSWFLPAASKIEKTLRNEICFANLRGDVRSFMKQFHLLLNISSVLCLLLPSKDPEPDITEILNETMKYKAKVILIFKEPCANNYFTDLKRKHQENISIITKTDEESKYEFLQCIRESIQLNLHQVKATPLVELAAIAGKHGILLDGGRPLFKLAASWLNLGIKRAKNLLKLQKHVPMLAVLEREKFFPKLRATISKSDRTRQEDMEEIYQDIEAERNAQRESLEQLDEELLGFLNSLTIMDQTERNRVLSGFRHHLDKISLEDTSKLHQEYRDVLLSRQKESRKTLQMSDPQSPKQDNLERILAQLSELSFGLEHVIREIAQLYQLGNCNYDYAGAAAEMLLSGQPLELLDGDSSYFPLPWFNAVYSNLERKTNNAKIFVISVLGVQSSGKSTMLNTMFGLEFPVSAGKCTRGAFASLLPVSDSLKSASKFDYVLIVDTEGLRGSSDPKLREHDNELATFAIGVSDLTIVNIFGANHYEMKEYLEIAVHAFLKMKLVDETKTCKLVHQNVVATDATDKSTVDLFNLKQDLDKMTKLAARQENCEDKFQTLNDIISFDENEDVFYVPGLLTGSRPMAPVNPEYGRVVQEIKNDIISLMCSKEIFRHSISQFRDRVGILWTAMLKENFIFSFRNTIEVRAYTSLDRKYFQESVNVMVIGMAGLEKVTEVALKRCTTNDELLDKWHMQEKNIRRDAGRFAMKMKKAMKEFIETSEDNAILEQWREIIMTKIEQQKDMQVMEVSKNCKSTLNYLQDLQDVNEKKRIYEKDLIEKAKMFMTSARDTDDIKKCKAAFDQEWQQWILSVPPFQGSKINVQNEMASVLCDTDAYLNSEMSEKLALKSLCRFKNIAPEIHLDQIHISDTSKINHGQVGMIFSARNILEKAVEEGLIFAKTTSRTGIRCTRNYLTQLYHKVITTIEKESEYHSVKFSKDLKCDILLHAFGRGYETFAQMEERYVDERNIRDNLERTLRPRLEKYFLQLCEKMGKDVLAATSFVDVLKNPIELELNQSMGPAVAKEVLKKKMFQSKGQFHANVLIQLGEEGKFEPYIPYLLNPVNFLQKKLQESIESYCLHQENSSMNLLLKNVVKRIKDTVCEAISKAYEEAKTKGENLTFFIQLFVEECKELPITKDMFAVVAIDDDLEDMDVFKKSVDEKVQLFLDSLIMSGINEETVQHWNPSPHNYLLTSMFGCQDYCPFCKGLCDQTVQNHPGYHSTRIHRPQGVNAYGDYRTNTLVVSICTNDVACKKKRFRNTDTSQEWHYYKEYQSVNDYYKSWSIPPDTSFETSTYWQWFMATFSKDLAEHFKRKEPDIPSSWKSHSFEKVKEDLQKQYNMLDVESRIP